MIDSHCHFDFEDFDADRDQIWQSACDLGLESLLIPATEYKGFSKIQQLAKQNPKLRYALGLHPWFLTAESLTDLPRLESQLKGTIDDHQLIAIGETGLDFEIDVPVDLQETSLVFHLKLASKLSLPVIIHHRKSHNRLIQFLKQFPEVNGVIHAFSGSAFEAQTYAEMGFMLGIGGTITYERSHKTKQAIKAVDLCHLLLETDAPAMPMFGRQGQRNSPEYLPQVASVLSELLQLSVSEIEQATDANFYRLFHRARQ